MDAQEGTRGKSQLKIREETGRKWKRRFQFLKYRLRLRQKRTLHMIHKHATASFPCFGNITAFETQQGIRGRNNGKIDLFY